MKILKIFFALLIFYFSFQFCFAQGFVESENWIGTIEGGQPPFLIHSFKNYSEQDVISAKKKLKSIHESETKDEWEGSYSLFGELSDNKLLWNAATGFVNYYIYTCAIELRTLNYGSVINAHDSITLFSEKAQPPFPGTGKTGQRKLIKVKWGDRHYLVDEEDLEDFGELAAGYYEAKYKEIEVNGEKFTDQVFIWNSFWVMSSDSYKKKVFGLPILPKPYERFVKLPIKTKIISIGKIEKNTADENSFPSATHYLTIGAGKDKGVKKGMSFYVPILRERVSIERVNGKTSIAVLTRNINEETQKEECFVIGQEISCVTPSVGMEVKTIPAEFLED